MVYEYNVEDTATEDKETWCCDANKWEDEFILDVLPQFGLVAEANNREDRYAPDLIINEVLGDLKYSENPFIKAALRYGIEDCRYEHSFNKKDYIRYRDNYPEIMIFFWHRFNEKTYKIGKEVYKVEPMNAVWYIQFERLAKLIKADAFPLHEYTRRHADQKGNAKDSYILNLELKNFTFLGSVK